MKTWLRNFSPFHGLLLSLAFSLAIGWLAFDYESIAPRDRQIFLAFYLILSAAAGIYRFGLAGMSRRTQILMQFAFILLGSMLCLVALVSLLRGDWRAFLLMVSMLGLPGAALLWAGRNMMVNTHKEVQR